MSAPGKQVIMPDEVESRNIITAKELHATVRALDIVLANGVFGHRKMLPLMRSARRKIQRVLDGMESA